MKIDNIFKRTVSDKVFSDQYNIPFGKYKTISDGLFANDCHVKMLATMLKAIDDKVEEKKSEQRIYNQDSKVELTENEMTALYKKVMKQLQLEF